MYMGGVGPPPMLGHQGPPPRWGMDPGRPSGFPPRPPYGDRQDRRGMGGRRGDMGGEPLPYD